MLVEQNAAMALKIAHHAVVLEVGQVALARDAAELAASHEVRERYLGIAGEEDIKKVTAEPIKRVTAGKRDPKPLAVEDVTVRFGGLEALSGVSLGVEPGTTHAIIGPNGAGKSTLLNVLTGVYRAGAGRVAYGDHALTSLRPPQIAALGISRTFQNLALARRACVSRTSCWAVTGSRGRASSRAASSSGGTQGARRAGTDRRRHRRAVGPGRGARRADELAALWHAQARGGGARDLRRAGPPAARRAGGGHERRRVGGGSALDRAVARGAGHLGRPRRARHAVRDGGWPTG